MSKALIGRLFVWANAVPEAAARILGELNGSLIGTFSSWYIYVVAVRVIVCSFLAQIAAGQQNQLFAMFDFMLGSGLASIKSEPASSHLTGHRWAANTVVSSNLCHCLLRAPYERSARPPYRPKGALVVSGPSQCPTGAVPTHEAALL